ncbi:MAG: glucose-6-phosphate dehydrogenase assembly protein OpcA [Acidobacteriaceae bacterium]|nr:glucose-6-phosphate dehydrogenase assembly protein OpcA [Acidobacteriaceae bacterium]MBV9295677.1 glucose-6-phosphate dehydrogenase assembly protein OpcA [Acidobacteriaceae bacterium]MBV9765485.1 glucose-6-phosphate dehydrogenase assembly protein OpcA [Acidobacteriaceae bacterium]
MSSAVIFPAQPEQILKGLGKLWTSLGQEEKHQGRPTVLRACAMTLIAATDEEDSGFSASQTISELMREHPSRGIVLAVSQQAERGVEARILAQCWKPFGKAQQICCEQIEITSRPENWPNIGPILIGLTAADLPVVLWCRHKAALSPSATADQKAGLLAVMNLATKIIIDTKGEDATQAIELLAKWRAERRLVADLEWTRLTRWRQPIAQIFDNPSTDSSFSKFGSIEVSYTDEKPCPSVFYIAGWLSAPYGAKVAFKKVEGYGPGLHGITLRSPSETIEFERTSCDCMSLRSTKGRERKYNFNDSTLYTLMNEELSVLGPDPAFNAAFARAEELLDGR